MSVNFKGQYLNLAKLQVEMGLISIFGSVLIQTIFYFLNYKLSLIAFFIPLIVFALYLFYRKDKYRYKESIIGLLVFCSILFLIFLYDHQFIQYAWDGSDYHGGAIVEMLRGWNPIYNTHAYAEFTMSMWSIVYPKLTWIYGALFAELTGFTSSAMIINILVAILAAIKVFLYIYRKTGNFIISIFVGMVIFLNPVFLEQIHTFYVDGLIGHLIVLLIIYNLEITDEYNRTDLVFIAILSIILMNIKFTGLIFAGLIDVGAFMYFLVKNKNHALEYFIAGIFMLAIGLGVIGYNPYMINLLNGRHIFHPLMGSDSIDIMTKNTPDFLLSMSIFDRIIYSFKSGQSMLWNLVNVKSLGYLLYDQRIGGFGSQFFKLLLISLMTIFILTLRFFHKIPHNTIFIFLGFLGSILFNYSYLWWARYVPHLWLLIPLTIFILLSYKGKLRILTIFMAFFMVILVLYQSQDIYRNTYAKDQDYTQNAKAVFKQLKSREDLTVYFETFGYLNIIPVYLEQVAEEQGVDIANVIYYEAPKQTFECHEIFYSKICVQPEVQQ